MAKNENKTVLVSIVMTYFERKQQTERTLESFVYHGYFENVEIIIVDDGSIKEPLATVRIPSGLNVKTIYLDPKKKWYSNPCIPFNVGFKNASGKIVILQNAECFHFHNIIEHAIKNMKEKHYLVYSCLSISENIYNFYNKLENFPEVLKNTVFPDRKSSSLGDFGWYCHSIFNPRALHFCSAISRTDLKKLKGFDRHYAKGICFDDDEFLHRVTKLCDTIKIVDEYSVIHQWHYIKTNQDESLDRKYLRNEFLFKNITKMNKPYFVFIFKYLFPSYFHKNISILKKIVKKIIRRTK